MKMVLQFAVRDIGQLTDFERARWSRRIPRRSLPRAKDLGIINTAIVRPVPSVR
jgi:hypothetical protein